MKKIVFFTCFILLGFQAFMQTEIVLNFDILQNGTQLFLDSILVENQTVGCDTMIYNTQSGFSLNMISGLRSDVKDKENVLIVKQNYPNPFSGETTIDTYIPGKTVVVKIFDTTGKMLLTENFNLGKGSHSFIFVPGESQQYVVSFLCEGQEQSIKLTHSGKSDSNLLLKHKVGTDILSTKSVKEINFIYNQNDVLNFTGYVTACYAIESTTFTDSPIISQTYNFDFTSLTELQPEQPVVLEITATQTSVYWSWSPVEDAEGYKCHLNNDYENATDVETYTSLTFETVASGTNFDLYVWAYNNCGVSAPLHLDTCTQALPLTQDEIDLILDGPSTTKMYVLDICTQPDSLILRTNSTNVIIGEENLEYLTDRMKKTVVGTGVGIAAPQVGINRRIIWVQRYDIGTAVHPWGLYFNPRIVNYSDTFALLNDGCLSVPDACETANGITGKSYRATWVDVEYYLADGTFVQERINQAYTAHIFQHEIDHLDGIMFFDRQDSPGFGK